MLKPTKCEPIQFGLPYGTNGGEDKFSISPITCAHLMGEARSMARAAGTDTTLAHHEFFRMKLAEHLKIEPIRISEELNFLIIEEYSKKIEELKKTSVVTDDSASS